MTDPKAPHRARPTLAEIAARAGTSRSTVSRAFGRPDLLRPETVAQILAIAQEIGYVPNTMARALSTGRTGNIGLVVTDISNPFFPPLIKAVQEGADAAGLCLFLGSSSELAPREDVLLQRMRGQTDGIILAASRLPDAEILAHGATQPLVLINRDVAALPRVLIDTGRAMAEAVDWLAAHGHRRIAYLAGPAGSWSNRQRQDAAAAACAARGLDFTVMPLENPDFDCGGRAAAAAVAAGATALLAFDDLVAQGAHHRLTQDGLRLPADVSLIGCDDALPQISAPALSSLSGHSHEAGAHAMALLRSLISGAGAGGPAQKITLTARFIPRDTTGPAPR